MTKTLNTNKITPIKKKTFKDKVKKSLFVGCVLLTSTIMSSCDYVEKDIGRQNRDEFVYEDTREGGNNKGKESENREDKGEKESDKNNKNESESEYGYGYDEEEEEKVLENSLCPKNLEDRFELDNVSGKFGKGTIGLIDDKIELKTPPFATEITLNGSFAKTLSYSVDGKRGEEGIIIQENVQNTYEINGEIITFEGCYVKEGKNMIFAINKGKEIVNLYEMCEFEMGRTEEKVYEIKNNKQTDTIKYDEFVGYKCEMRGEEVVKEIEVTFENTLKYRNENVDGVDRHNIFVDGKEYFTKHVTEEKIELYDETLYLEGVREGEVITFNGEEIEIIEINENYIEIENRGIKKTLSNERKTFFLNNLEKIEVRLYSNDGESINIGFSLEKDDVLIGGLGDVGQKDNFKEDEMWKVMKKTEGITNEEGVVSFTIKYDYRYIGEYVEDKK